MQRLFISFPGGLQGAGLLCVRLAIAITLFCIATASWPLLRASGCALMLKGVGLLALGFVLTGFLTPIASCIVILEAVAILVFSPAARPSSLTARLLSIDVCVLLTAAATLGPGAFSLDARVFGRREIIFPD